MSGRILSITCSLTALLLPWAIAGNLPAQWPSSSQPTATPQAAAVPTMQAGTAFQAGPEVQAHATQQAGAPAHADENRPLLVALRNGETLTGRVTKEKERYVIDADGIEIRLPLRDVDFVCRSLDEAYAIQRQRIASGRAEDRLRLANWCLKHGLLGSAAAELAAAIEVNPRLPEIAVLDRRLQQALAMAAASQPPESKLRPAVKADLVVVNKVAVAPSTQGVMPETISPGTAPMASIGETAPAKRAPPRVPISGVELDRLSRALPGGTLEQFTETIQPLLTNSCSTVGCHGPASKAQYGLIRPASNGRVVARGLSQRNLFNTLEWVDHKHPAESELLVKAREPHGGKPVAPMTEESFQYRQLVAWVHLATGTKPEPHTAAAQATIAPAAYVPPAGSAPGSQGDAFTPFEASQLAPYVENANSSAPMQPEPRAAGSSTENPN